MSRTSFLARRKYGDACITVILVTNRLKILKFIKSFFISLTMSLLSTLACRYVALFSFQSQVCFYGGKHHKYVFHAVFIKLKARVHKKLIFSHWLFTPMKKLTISSSSLEMPELQGFSNRAYLQSHLSVWEQRKIIKYPSLVYYGKINNSAMENLAFVREFCESLTAV